MPRMDLLLRIQEEVDRGKKIPQRQFLVKVHPLTRIETKLGFTFEGMANNASLRPLLHVDKLLPFEPLNTFVVMLLTTGGGTLFDIGANIGYFSLLAACNATGPIQAHAFEPSPTQFPFLVNNIALNDQQGRILPYNIGLGDEDAHGELSIHGTGSSFMRGWDRGNADAMGTRTVAIKRLDDLFPKPRLRGPVVVKIDVEGYELPVLRGAESVLRMPDVACVLIEATHERYADRNNPDALADIQTLTDYGFTPYGIKHRIPSIRATNPDPKENGLLEFSDPLIDSSNSESWPTSWVCLRAGHPAKEWVLEALRMYPYFLATYFHTEQDLAEILASVS